MTDFCTPEQIKNAEKEWESFKQNYPDASNALVALWKVQYMQVGHKVMGRLILGKTADQLIK